MSHSLQATHLTKRYPNASVDAVSQLNLTIDQGEIFGFLGPNGAGKSTAVQLFATTLFPTSGSVKIAGQDTVTQAENVRRNIGVVFQNPSLDLNLTVEENFRFHAVLHGLTHPALNFGGTSPQYQARVTELLEVFGLTDRKDAIIKTLSGGLKRRVDIAKALLHVPKILFLDEPTTGLDPESRRSVWEYLQKLQKLQKFTLFLTTQYLEEAEICQRIGIIHKGNIVALDSPKALKASLGKQYLVLDTKAPKKLAQELQSLSLGFRQDESGTFFVELQNANGQEILRKLQTPLSLFSTKEPSLDDVFFHYAGSSLESKT